MTREQYIQCVKDLFRSDDSHPDIARAANRKLYSAVVNSGRSSKAIDEQADLVLAQIASGDDE